MRERVLSAVGVLAATVITGWLATQPTVLGIVLGVTVVVAWPFFCTRRPVAATLVIVAFIAFSSHIFAVMNVVGVPSSALRAALAVKYVLAWLLLAALLTRNTVNRWSVFQITGSGLILVAAWLLDGTPAGLTVAAGAIRGAIMPLLALGTVALLSAEERARVARWTCIFAALAAATGLVQMALPMSFSRDILGIGRYWAEVKRTPIFLNPVTGLPGNFFTTQGSPRLSGTFGDPLSAGECLGAAVVLTLAYRHMFKRPHLLAAFLTVALVLTYTRDGWLLAAFGFLAISIKRRGFGVMLARATAIAVAVWVAVLLVPSLNSYVTGVLGGTDASTAAHRQAFFQSLSYALTPLGSGWGTAGSFAYNFNPLAVTSESAVLDLFTQIGWIGTACYAFVLLLLAWVAMRGGRNRFVSVAMLAAITVSAFVSENVFTFNAGWLPLFAVGLVALSPPVVADRPKQAPRTAPVASPRQRTHAQPNAGIGGRRHYDRPRAVRPCRRCISATAQDQAPELSC